MGEGEAGESEHDIERALFVGNFSAALDACLHVCPLPCAVATIPFGRP